MLLQLLQTINLSHALESLVLIGLLEAMVVHQSSLMSSNTTKQLIPGRFLKAALPD
jgi:hypothetical protein